MRLHACRCSRRGPGDDYEAGPTACIAHPRVIRNIKSQISANSILSTAAARFALSPPSGKTELNCLVLLVDFPDNVGSEPPSHFENLLFDQTNSNSMASFYKEMSFDTLTVTGQVTNWIRAANPYTFYTNGESGTGGSFPNNTPGLQI